MTIDEKPTLAILVDDDVLVRMSWQRIAKQKGINLVVFSEATEFLNQLKQYDLLTPIYIDSNLGQNVKGEEVAKKVFDLGYRELYLTTGYPSDFFENVKELFRGIIGKDCPWL